MENSPLLSAGDGVAVEVRPAVGAETGGGVGCLGGGVGCLGGGVGVAGEEPDGYLGARPRRRNSSVVTDTSGSEDLYIQQAVVFIEDAIKYRSIYHRMDVLSLRLYRFYYSVPYQYFLNATLLLLLALAFFERPSSLTRSADLRRAAPGDGGSGLRRPDPPCGISEAVEVTLLLVLAMDVSIKAHLLGWREFVKSKWLVAYVLVLSLSFIDWTVSVGTTCLYVVRVRRAFRPFFLLQNSSLMKKTLKCIRRTLPQIASVMLLLALHLYFFTVLGMLLFQRGKVDSDNTEWELYFETFTQALTSLLVLLTTANNPDVMIPAYSANRLYALFFLSFSVIGTYFLMNLLTAIIYNQFRGYLVNSIRAMLLRRRVGVRAAFEILSTHEQQRSAGETHDECVSSDLVRRLLCTISVDSAHRRAMIQHLHRVRDGSVSAESFQKIFAEMDKDTVKEVPSAPAYEHPALVLLQRVCRHRYFDYVGNVFALANVLCITVELAIDARKAPDKRDDYFLGVMNCAFIIYYLLEQLLKLLALGWRSFFTSPSNAMDGVFTLCLVVVEIVCVSVYGFPHPGWNPEVRGSLSLWEIVRIVNLLIVLRLIRIIPHIKGMALVAGTLLDLIRNLRSFAGILLVVYYAFAIVGMELFRGDIVYTLHNGTVDRNASVCGSYEQLQYWSSNFDDFAAALMLLWDVMVVNNWQVFLEAFSRYSGPWSQVYFICWWLVSSVIWVNLFVALILESFITKWDGSQHADSSDCSSNNEEHLAYGSNLHHIFRKDVEEPTEEELLQSLRHHPHVLLRP